MGQVRRDLVEHLNAMYKGLAAAHGHGREHAYPSSCTFCSMIALLAVLGNLVSLADWDEIE